MKKLAHILVLSTATLLNSCSLDKNLSSKYESNFQKGEKEFYYNPKDKLIGSSPEYNIREINNEGDTILYKTNNEYDTKKESGQSFKLEKMKIISKSLDTTIKDKNSKVLYYHEGHLNWAFGFDRHPVDRKEIF
ncbi:MAG: hypothetical protein ABEI74_02195 [Candidatus Pacearchaeota archaeon]